MVEMVVTAGAIGRAKLQSNHYHQQTNTKSFSQAGCPSCCPTNTEGKNITFHGLAYPKLWPLIAPGYLGGGGGCHASHQPSDASTHKNELTILLLIAFYVKYYVYCLGRNKRLEFATVCYKDCVCKLCEFFCVFHKHRKRITSDEYATSFVRQ